MKRQSNTNMYTWKLSNGAIQKRRLPNVGVSYSLALDRICHWLAAWNPRCEHHLWILNNILLSHFLTLITRHSCNLFMASCASILSHIFVWNLGLRCINNFCILECYCLPLFWSLFTTIDFGNPLFHKHVILQKPRCSCETQCYQKEYHLRSLECTN